MGDSSLRSSTSAFSRPKTDPREFEAPVALDRFPPPAAVKMMPDSPLRGKASKTSEGNETSLLRSSSSSAFTRPRPDSRGFDAPAMLGRYTAQLPVKVMPDTPLRRPNKSSDLIEARMLLSSSKKQMPAGSPRVSSPGSAAVSRRKRLKGPSLDATSPMRITRMPQMSPLRDLGKAGGELEGDEDSFLDDEFMELEEDEIDDDEDALPSDTIPQCSPVGVLGDGNFSKVSTVICSENKKKYALKECKGILSRSAKENALKELRRWDSLKHPRITQFLRAWQEDACLYVLMHLCESGTLERYVESHVSKYGSVENRYLCAAFRDCCLGLSYMHANSLVHMDIKPSNICISNGRAMLCDFNLIREIGEFFDKETDNRYAAVEVMQMNYRVHSSADMFALGISFLELVTNKRLPPSGDSWTNLRQQGPALEDYVEARSHSPLFPLIRCCMKPDPQERPAAKDLLMLPVMDVPRDVKLIPACDLNINYFARPASATLVSGSPRDSGTPKYSFECLAPSPVNRSPAVSRNASRNPSPHFHQKRLDFSSTSSPVGDAFLDENSLADRFTTQAVVTPRPGTATPSANFSRASSPRLFSSSPTPFGAGGATAAQAGEKPSERSAPTFPTKN